MFWESETQEKEALALEESLTALQEQWELLPLQ